MYRKRKKGLLVTVAVVATAALALAGAMSAGASGGSKTAATPPALIAQATAVLKAATTGMIHNAVDEPTINSLTQIQSVKGWPGPTSTPTPPKGKKIAIVVCLFGTACEDSGREAAKAAALLGWKADVIDGKGTPATYFQAMDSVLAKGYDAIITMAIPESLVADKIAAAHKKHIPVVGIASIPEKASSDHYDAYVSYHEITGSALQAAWVIASSKGTGKVVMLWDYGYPHLVAGATVAKRILAQCTGCKLLELQKRELATAADPVAMSKITTALVNKYGKDLQYIMTPYGFGVAPIIEALRAAGRSDVQVLSNNGEKQQLAFVANGQMPADSGVSVPWSGYAAIDQTIRLLDGQKALPDFQEGVSVRLFVKSNAPKTGVFNWNTLVNVAGEYKKLWGLK